ncbi:hypothetical protein H4219_004461 [Mycoemilia scoparia]|uniref:Uncharacterized protein n=1 Tax=Mycoemilia scoparia TaxID=417184 RepID=A0A9W7ZXE1_9FUNG|nr:hypothetical protein H4219_004461 [Mycoemilia scoparia]
MSDQQPNAINNGAPEVRLRGTYDSGKATPATAPQDVEGGDQQNTSKASDDAVVNMNGILPHPNNTEGNGQQNLVQQQLNARQASDDAVVGMSGTSTHPNYTEVNGQQNLVQQQLNTGQAPNNVVVDMSAAPQGHVEQPGPGPDGVTTDEQTGAIKTQADRALSQVNKVNNQTEEKVESVLNIESNLEEVKKDADDNFKDQEGLSDKVQGVKNEQKKKSKKNKIIMCIVILIIVIMIIAGVVYGLERSGKINVFDDSKDKSSSTAAAAASSSSTS